MENTAPTATTYYRVCLAVKRAGPTPTARFEYVRATNKAEAFERACAAAEEKTDIAARAWELHREGVTEAAR
jgi:hypothetical protein